MHVTFIMQVFRDERLLDNVNARGAQLTNGLKALASKYPIKEVHIV
jgi:4-aminobutyrate aminotransferase-like enzyme